MGVRFVHAADLHLGSPLEAAGTDSEDLREQLRDATYIAFRRIIDITLEEEADFLLLAGDLYDEQNRSVRANEFLAKQFSRLDESEITVYIIYGNHDPLGSATTYVELPPNVHEFGHDAASEEVYINGDTPAAGIWGQSYRTEAEPRKMHTEFNPADESLPNIGLLHTGVDPNSDRYVPSSVTELAEIDHIHYWALGHIHQPRVYQQSPPVVHPGIPQGRNIGEPGPGGCVVAEIEANGAVQLEYVPTNPVEWRKITVPVDDENAASFNLTTVDGIQRYLETIAEDLRPRYEDLEDRLGIPVRCPEWAVEGFVCRWQLSGHDDVNEFISTNDAVLDRVEARLCDSLASEDPFVYTDSVDDRTGPPLPDIADLRDEDSVGDELFALMDEIEDSEDDQDTIRDQLDYDKSENIWQRVEDPEEVDDDKLALTEERLNALVERAQDLMLNELVRQRVD
jgi:DNA repair exonuclease SbcCD nuclease subunit